MPSLYAVTFKSDSVQDPFKVLKLQLTAEDQLHALKLALAKASQMKIKVTRVEELGAISSAARQLNPYQQYTGLQPAV